VANRKSCRDIPTVNGNEAFLGNLRNRPGHTSKIDRYEMARAETF